MNIGLHECPEVLQIAEATGLDPFGVVGRLHRVWGWFDQNTVDGNATCVTGVTLDRFTCTDGFANAMVQAGWLSTTASGLSLPNFDRHNGESAKKRAQTARRVAKNRVKPLLHSSNAASVTSVTVAALPEKRREEKKREAPTSPLFRARESEGIDSDAIAKAIHDYCRAANKRFSNEALKSAVEEIQSGRVTQAELIHRLHAICASARRNPQREKAFLPSPQRLLSEGQYLSDPASFVSAKASDSGTVGLASMPEVEEFYD